MDARFLVPWRPDGGVRDDVWAFVSAWWARECRDVPIVTADSPPGPFSRSRAINAAARGTWDVGIVLDADVIADGEQVRAAIDRATATGRLTLAFERYAALTQKGSDAARRGDTTVRDRNIRFQSMHHESSIVVVPRAVWDAVGGFDERFVGWGQEDVAFVHAARILTGQIERVSGTVWHLWHPSSPHKHQRRDPFYVAAQELGRQYRRANDRESMRRLLVGRTS